MSGTDEERLSREADKILKGLRVEPMLECKTCHAELTLKMEVIPGNPPTLSRLAYNCQYCFSMNVVWAAPGIIG